MAFSEHEEMVALRERHRAMFRALLCRNANWEGTDEDILAAVAAEVDATQPEFIREYKRSASKDAVRDLKRVTISEENTELPTCTICLIALSVGDESATLPCEHSYHSECIGSWLERDYRCPVCRHELPREND